MANFFFSISFNMCSIQFSMKTVIGGRVDGKHYEIVGSNCLLLPCGPDVLLVAFLLRGINLPDKWVHVKCSRRLADPVVWRCICSRVKSDGEEDG
jgi:hypothetical protein